MYFKAEDYRVVKAPIICVLENDFLLDGVCDYKCKYCEYNPNKDKN